MKANNKEECHHNWKRAPVASVNAFLCVKRWQQAARNEGNQSLEPPRERDERQQKGRNSGISPCCCAPPLSTHTHTHTTGTRQRLMTRQTMGTMSMLMLSQMVKEINKLKENVEKKKKWKVFCWQAK